MTGFFIFRIGLPLLILAFQFVLWKRAVSWLSNTHPGVRWGRTTATVVFLLFNIALVIVILLRPRLADLPAWFLYCCAYPFFIWHASTFFIGLVILVGMLVKFPFKSILWISRRSPSVKARIRVVQDRPEFQQFDVSRRVFLRRSMYGLTALSFGGSTYGLLVEKKSCEITTAEFAIPDLPPQLSGFTIALISDIHSSVFMGRSEMDRYVDVVNSLGADMIAVPGDFVNSLNEEVYPFAESFSGLRAPYGIYGVMGNHDFFALDPELVAREVDGCGVRLLRNEKVIIEKNGGQMCLLGIDDTGRPQRASERIETALGHTPPGIPKILLCHRPYFLQQAAEKSIHLVLSGHTHGGQLVFGQLGDTVLAPASLASRYIWGKYRINGTHMYVSRGIGTVGIPIRVNCPPEVTKITLTRA